MELTLFHSLFSLCAVVIDNWTKLLKYKQVQGDVSRVRPVFDQETLTLRIQITNQTNNYHNWFDLSESSYFEMPKKIYDRLNVLNNFTTQMYSFWSVWSELSWD